MYAIFKTLLPRFVGLSFWWWLLVKEWGLLQLVFVRDGNLNRTRCGQIKMAIRSLVLLDFRPFRGGHGFKGRYGIMCEVYGILLAVYGSLYIASCLIFNVFVFIYDM